MVSEQEPLLSVWEAWDPDLRTAGLLSRALHWQLLLRGSSGIGELHITDWICIPCSIHTHYSGHTEQDVLPGTQNGNKQNQKMGKKPQTNMTPNFKAQSWELMKMRTECHWCYYSIRLCWSVKPESFQPPSHISLKPVHVGSYASYFPPLGIWT